MTDKDTAREEAVQKAVTTLEVAMRLNVYEIPISEMFGEVFDAGVEFADRWIPTQIKPAERELLC